MMKLSRTFFALCLTALLLQSQSLCAVDYNTTVDKIWGDRNFQELNGQYYGVHRSDKSMTWPSNDKVVVVYCLRVPAGHVRADAVFTPKSGRKVTFNLRVVEPETGEVITTCTSTSDNTKAQRQTMEVMPDVVFPRDTWYRFEFTSPKGSTNLSSLDHLEFQREGSLAVGDSPIYMAPSVHLNGYWTSAPGAPAGESYDWIYIEVMYPAIYQRLNTYVMSIGDGPFYSGIQTTQRSDGTYNHGYIFSVWDNGDTDSDPNLPDYLRSGALDKGDDVYVTRFGGEGTGASARMPEGQWWLPDHWVQFIINARPEQVEVEVQNADGTTQTITYNNTIESMWFKMADEPEWHYFASLRESGRNHLYGGFYSFIENFTDNGGELFRRAYFRNPSMHSAASGKWYARNSVSFTHTQGDSGNRFSRTDFGHGVTAIYDNCFYMQTGGFVAKHDSASSMPLPTTMEWVDTINLEALTARIDRAILAEQAQRMSSTLDKSRVVSDPSVWEVFDYSDEETEGEGSNGRAAQVLDGSESTYWHTRWKPSNKGYPHTLSFDAKSIRSVSSISFYQSRDADYRVKTAYFYTSDDGKTWQQFGDKISVPNTDRPVITLDSLATARYFRLKFTQGYGAGINIVINEMQFRGDYRLDDLLATARSFIDKAGQFGSYSPADLQQLIEVYADGTCTDVEALIQALTALTTQATPLKYGTVGSMDNISSFRALQLRNQAGRGVLVAQRDPSGADILTVGESTQSGALDTYTTRLDVTDPYANWLLLRSELHDEYYIYNLGARKFLHTGSTPTLSAEPMAIAVAKGSNKGYTLGASGARIGIDATKNPAVIKSSAVSAITFELRTNYALTPQADSVKALLARCEDDLHFGDLIDERCATAMDTYAKAFVATPGDTRLVTTTTQLTSNANNSQQSSHSLAKLIDNKKSTYYETWYSGISWPATCYITFHPAKAVGPFFMTFSPSQDAQYGLTDIPQTMRIYAGNTSSKLSIAKVINEGMPTSIDTDYLSPAIYPSDASSYLRFEVLSTYANRENGHVWAMSEFQLHPAVIDEEASPYYRSPQVAAAADTLLQTVRDVRAAIKAGTIARADGDRLQQAIDALEQALSDPSSVNKPTAIPHGGPLRIYTTQGHLLYEGPADHTPALSPGIYIRQHDGISTKQVIR